MLALCISLHQLHYVYHIFLNAALDMLVTFRSLVFSLNRSIVANLLLHTATAYGLGVYFATNFNYSARRTYSPPDQDGIKYVFQCRVLTGQFTVGSPGMKEPPHRTDTVKFRYDSVTNDVRNPEIFVIFNDNQSYPEYLVAFKG